MIEITKNGKTPVRDDEGKSYEPSWNSFIVTPKEDDGFYEAGTEYQVVFHKIFNGKLSMHQYPVPAKGYSYRLFETVDELVAKFDLKDDGDENHLREYMKRKPKKRGKVSEVS